VIIHLPLIIIEQADLKENNNDALLWATLLKNALYTATERLDAWQSILRTHEVLQDLEDDTVIKDDHLVLFYKRIRDRLRLFDLRETLACSKHMREYFRTEKTIADAEPRLVPKGSAKDINHPGRARLLSLLRTMTEPVADQYIPHERHTWVDEIYSSLGDSREHWITNYGLKKTEDCIDASILYSLLKRTWDYMGYDLSLDPADERYSGWKSYSRFSDNLRAIEIEDFVKIVRKHLDANKNQSQVPSFQDCFNYVGHHGSCYSFQMNSRVISGCVFKTRRILSSTTGTSDTILLSSSRFRVLFY
jgi:hypothetical protein